MTLKVPTYIEIIGEMYPTVQVSAGGPLYSDLVWHAGDSLPSQVDLDAAILTAVKLLQRKVVNDYRSVKLYGGYTHPHVYPITDVTTGLNGTFVVDSDATIEFPAAAAFIVTGSTGNDGAWTVSSSSYDGGTTKTTLTVTGTIPDATVDGSTVVYIPWNSAPVDIQNLNAIITLILAGAITTDVEWHDFINISHMMTSTQLVTLAGGLGVFAQTCYAVSWVHKNAIDALTTVAEIEAYDYTTSWPA